MKNSEKDWLEELFQEVRPEDTSGDFMEKLMVRVEKEAIRQKRRKVWLTYLWMAAGIVGIIAIPACVFYYMGVNVEIPWNTKPDWTGLFSGIDIDPSFVMFALVILLLLVGDGLIRRFRAMENEGDR